MLTSTVSTIYGVRLSEGPGKGKGGFRSNAPRAIRSDKRAEPPSCPQAPTQISGGSLSDAERRDNKVKTILEILDNKGLDDYTRGRARRRDLRQPLACDPGSWMRRVPAAEQQVHARDVHECTPLLARRESRPGSSSPGAKSMPKR